MSEVGEQQGTPYRRPPLPRAGAWAAVEAALLDGKIGFPPATPRGTQCRASAQCAHLRSFAHAAICSERALPFVGHRRGQVRDPPPESPAEWLRARPQ